MGLNLDYEEGQTPLEEEEKSGLLIPTITTHSELNEFEQQNIEEAIQWVLGKRFGPERIFSDPFIRNLHKRMYESVWSWAGSLRKTNKNIGIEWHAIPIELRQLLDDALYWHNNQTYTAEEIAIRFKHKLVSIHCFSNGNGRHSRLMADIIIEKLYGMPVFTWGGNQLINDTDLRKTYIQSLQSADKGNFEKLLAFARS